MASPLPVALTTHLGDGQTFRAGDPLSFFLTLEQDAFVVLLYEDAAGVLTQLIPNASDPRGLMRAGAFIAVPGADDPYTLRVAAPFGQERAWAFVSDLPLPALPARAAGGVRQLNEPLVRVRARLREHAARAGARFGEASVGLRTEAP